MKAEQDDNSIDDDDQKCYLWRRRAKSESPTDVYEDKRSFFPQDNSQVNGFNGLEQPKSSKKSPHLVQRTQVNRARFILAKIAKNEAKGRTHPNDARDKVRCLATIEKFEKHKRENPPDFQLPNPQPKQKGPPVKRRRSAKRSKAGGPPKTKKLNEVVEDNLVMALVDELHDDGRLLNEKWEEIESILADMVTDRLMAVPQGPIPSFDSSEVIRGHRVIRCDDGFSKIFLAECVSRIGDSWNGLRIRLVHASQIPRRPQARIWLPKGQTDYTRVMSCLRAQNLDVDMSDWVILRAEEVLKASQPFVLLINHRCLPQLEASDYKVRYGIRMAKVKVLLAETDKLSEEDVEIVSWKREENFPSSSKSRRSSKE
ncbi:uncharacterized protein LOC121467547 [Drosophila elegans]|uniref:uncharacterized protein LOC121467547 n=1 Tax=Drosophila elegans TaxID=30023 RepID=UPI001BC83333|nr:uncharacterized protein LOC121467547 [Drosophila elegans]